MAADKKTFGEAVRSDDEAAVRRMLAEDPTLARIRWPGRSGDGRMRSLGPPPYDRHTWLTVPAGHDPDDPRYTSTPLIYSRNDAIVRLLVEAGADVNAKGTSGDVETPEWFFTPLWRAAHDGRMASVRLLVERGADVNYANPDGSNQALKTAAENERLEVCEYLFARGAKPDLITAAMLGLVDRIEALLHARRDCIHDRDSHGRSALDAATLLDSFRICRKGLHEGHDKVAAILIARGATLEPSHAAGLGLLDELKRLVGADPEAVFRPAQRPALIGGTAAMESALAAARRRERRDVVAYLETSLGWK